MKPEFVPVIGEDARAEPLHLMVVQGEARPAVHASDEPMVMTFPHLLVRELIAFLALSLGLVVVSLLFNAPLEELANPDKTPNPAKAPWYFLGLQELLHYYSPLISGVVLPSLFIIALAVIPYFKLNIERPSLWDEGVGKKLGWLWLSIALLSALFAFTGTHPVWPLIVPLWVVGAVMSGGAFVDDGGPWRVWLRTRSLPFWIFAWVALAATVLTIIGVFFRGPGWAFTLPWRDGIF